MKSKAASERSRIEWLLTFLRRDVNVLRPGEWLDLGPDIQRYVLSEMNLFSIRADRFDIPERGTRKRNIKKMDLRIPALKIVVQVWHQEVRRGLDALNSGKRWTINPPLDRTIVRLQQRDKSVVAIYSPLPMSIGLLSVTIDLLLEWYPQIRRCRHCSSWFLPRHGRQRYDTPTCSQQARWRKFAKTRRRDYKAEYAKRKK